MLTTVPTQNLGPQLLFFTGFKRLHTQQYRLLGVTHYLMFSQVSCSGEIRYDLGGVKTEFFYCLFEEMTWPEYGMFTYPEDAFYMWFPVKISPLYGACGIL